MTKSNFKIINAGAGSGKTFSLVLEYLTRLLNPKLELNHRLLLALTFTNKAVNELKSRVLNKLFVLKTNPAKEIVILNHLKNELKLTDEEIKSRSSLILKKIIFDYGSFDIITIDSFTYRIVRTFAKDFKLPSTFEVLLDNNEMLSEMVDSIIDDVGIKPEMTDTLISYSLSKILLGKSLNIKNDLFDFGKILLDENNRIPLNSIMRKSKKIFKDSKIFLNQRLIFLIKEINFLSLKALDLIHKNNLKKKDFFRGIVYSYFDKLKNDNYKSLYNRNLESSLLGSGQLYSKNNKELVKERIDSIRPNLHDFYSEIKPKVELIFLIKSLLNNWVPLSLSSIMGKRLEEMQIDQKKVLIDQFNLKISSIVNDQPVPYIFERLGQRYKHYFIDEFQDTSKLQWNNLIPLISNSLESEYIKGISGSLFLVGDAKQAIYRWRGGDVNQFLSLNEKKTTFQIDPEIKSLEINYRSKDEIVKFNNSFFKKSSIFLSDESFRKMFFKETQQSTEGDPGGYVSVTFIPKTKLKSEADNLYISRVTDTILSVLSRGFKSNQIAVLVRKKRQAIVLADGLLNNGIKILSSESLLINNSDSVNFLIALMKLAINHDNKRQYKIILDHLWNIKYRDSYEYHDFVKSYIELNKEEFFSKLSLLLENSFDFNKFKKFNIYEATEYAISHFDFIEISNVFVIHFLDNIFNFSIKTENNFYSYINYWNKNSKDLTISMSENIDAVRVLTIHKAKGLEFPVVILPFLDEPFIPRRINNNVWLPLNENILKDFDWGLVKFSENLKEMGLIGQEFYKYHKKLFELDAMTILYVAMTRAKNELHVFTQNLSESKSITYAHLFISYCKDLKSLSEGKFEWGKIEKNIDIIKNINETFILDINTNLNWKNKLFFDSNKKNLVDKRKKGLLIHEVLGQITNIYELDFVIENCRKKRLIDNDKLEILKSTISEIVNHNKLKEFFTNQYQILNEKEILNPSGEILRPDKIVISKNKTVIIDFKTGKPKEKDHIQVREYEQALTKMNYKNIEKLLVYINDSVFVKIV